MGIDDWLRLFPPGSAGKARLMALARAVLKQADELAELFESIPEAFSVNAAIGSQLDLLGESLGLHRSDLGNAMTDDDYREYILGTQALRRWNGRNEELKPLLEAAGITGTYADNMDGTVTAPDRAPILAGIGRT